MFWTVVGEGPKCADENQNVLTSKKGHSCFSVMGQKLGITTENSVSRFRSSLGHECYVRGFDPHSSIRFGFEFFSSCLIFKFDLFIHFSPHLFNLWFDSFVWFFYSFITIIFKFQIFSSFNLLIYLMLKHKYLHSFKIPILSIF